MPRSVTKPSRPTVSLAVKHYSVYFGSALSVKKNTIAVGSFVDLGAAYIYRRDVGGTENWGKVAKLTPCQYEPSGFYFHYPAVAVNTQETLVLLGISKADLVFEFQVASPTSWADMTEESAQLSPSSELTNDSFGFSVAISDHVVAVGAPGDTASGGSIAGAAYIYHGIADCTNNGVLDACDINNNPSLDGNNNGVPDSCDVCPPDFNADGIINATDLSVLLASWGACSGCPTDLNGDCIVDAADLSMILACWGACPC